jgi:NhaP-type Na+/H+ or K+/H+ antiporter
VGTWTFAAVAALVLVYAAGSRRFEGSLVTPAIFFTFAGLAAGPGLGLIDLPPRGEEVKVLAEATLTLVLFADASRISLRELRRGYSMPLRLLGVGLPLTIVAGTLVGAGVLPHVGFTEALVLAVVLACTDAALGRAVVTDPRLPSLIRQGLNVESGLNDGICVPIFFIAIGLAEADADTVSTHYAVHLVLEEIGYGTLAGVIAGVGAAVVERRAIRGGWAYGEWIQVLTFAAAVCAAGLALGFGGSIFIASFVAGLLFGALRHGSGGEVAHFLEQGSDVLNAVTFVVFGAVILGPALHHLTWEAVVYAVLSLTVVRMLPVAVALMRSGAERPTVAFIGWFGPRGLASIVFGVLLVDEADLPHAQTLLVAIAVTVALSVVAHGLSAAPLTGLYVAWFTGRTGRSPSPIESRPTFEHRVRALVGIPRTAPASRTDAERMRDADVTAG